MNDERALSGPSETAAPQKAVSAQECIPIVDAVYSYTLRDLNEFYPANNFVPHTNVPSPPAGSLVRIDIGRTKFLTYQQQQAAAHLAWKARRVQIVGQTSQVEWLRRFVVENLTQQAQADELTDETERRYREVWGESA